MPQVELSRRAVDNLDRLIRTHSLPPDTRARVRTVLTPLTTLPELGRQLQGRWSEHRVLLGPWRWMLVVYRHDPDHDRVVIATLQDARSSRAVTGTR